MLPQPRLDAADAVRPVDWPAVRAELARQGCARLPELLSPATCAGLRGLYGNDSRYRKTVDMARHRFGLGQYRYFGYPLPPLVARLREALYEGLHSLATEWAARLGHRGPYPTCFADYTARCHSAGARLPTPLVLRYGPGGYNTLHQDLFGTEFFPFQLVVGLSQPGQDYGGGEFVLVEQRPRSQSAAQVFTLAQGEGLVFPSHSRPVEGTRGTYRVALRHGVSPVVWGERYALGIVCHEANS